MVWTLKKSWDINLSEFASDFLNDAKDFSIIFFEKFQFHYSRAANYFYYTDILKGFYELLRVMVAVL